MPEEFDAGTGKAKNIMDSFIEALYGRSEETIPEEYDWFAPLLGDWEFDYKDKFIDGDRSRPQRQLKGEWIFRRVLNGCFKMENGILTGTVLKKPNRKWRFVERNENTFHWQNITIQENGDIIVNCEAFGKRK